MEKSDLVEDQVLKMAIQTVYHRRRNELESLLASGDEKILDHIVSEITHRAVQFQMIINAAITQLQENSR